MGPILTFPKLIWGRPSPTRILEKVCVEWADFIYKNRSRSAGFTHQYDVVIGPIADDGVAYLLNLYEEGLRTLEELAKELEYKDLNNQFCFLTDRAISLLHRVK
jgi:hypothetical protein